jgi:hypothetical protein
MTYEEDVNYQCLEICSRVRCVVMVAAERVELEVQGCGGSSPVEARRDQHRHRVANVETQ